MSRVSVNLVLRTKFQTKFQFNLQRSFWSIRVFRSLALRSLLSWRWLVAQHFVLVLCLVFLGHFIKPCLVNPFPERKTHIIIILYTQTYQAQFFKLLHKIWGSLIGSSPFVREVMGSNPALATT